MIKEERITHTNKRHAGPNAMAAGAGLAFTVTIWEVSMVASTGSAAELLPVLGHWRYRCSSNLPISG